MINRFFIAVLCVFAASVAWSVPTMDETFGGVERGFGPADSGWSTNAASLVGENCGSIFFDVRFAKPEPSAMGQRTVMTLRTASRLTVGLYAYGNSRLQFSFSDRAHTFRHDFKERIELDRTYRMGVTWDGEAVRFYIDGRVVVSSLQPAAFRPGIVRNLNLGPYKDSWHGMRTWPRDVFISRIRTWDVARTPAEVAKEEGIAFRPLSATHTARLTIPSLPVNTSAPVIDGKLDDEAWAHASSLPQLIRGNFTGKSGLLPPHAFRLAYDRDNLYLGVTTHFPPHDPFIEGQPRTETYEPEAWGTESFEFWLDLGGHRYRFASNVAGGTTEGRDKDKKKWNGEWRYAHSREMKIDDSILWQFEAAIPWRTLDKKGPPAAGDKARFNFARTWTLSTLGGFSSLDLTGRGYTINETCPAATFGQAASFRLLSRTDPSAGEYRQESEITAAGKAKMRYTLSLARLDGSLSPMAVYDRDRILATGEKATDVIDVKTDVPGYDALLHVLEENGRVVMREIVPYELNPELFTTTPLLLSEKVRVTPKKPLAGSFALVAPDGKDAAVQDAAAGETEFPFPRSNAAGEWRVELRTADGKVAGARKFSYPGVGEWERQDFHEDWILPPFTPMAGKVSSNGLEVSLCCDRVYGWNGSFLPSRVKALGEDIFAAPPEILVNGAPAACDTFATVSNAPHHAGFEARGEDAAAEVCSKGWLEYDGVQWNEIGVTPKRGGSTIQIRYSLKPAFAKYLHAAAGSGWGAKRTIDIADGVQELSAFPVLWTGDEEKGWTFFYETRADWTSNPKKTYMLEKTGDAFTVTVNVARKLPVGKTFRFAFGFQATPMRPRASNYPFDTLAWSWAAPMNTPGRRRPTYDIIYLVARGGGDLGSFFGDQDTDDCRKTDAAIARDLSVHCKGHAGRPVFYTCSRHLSVRYPEVAAYIAEWKMKPEIALDYSHTGHFLYDCCPTTKASDYFSWRFRDMLRRHPELKGIYLDFGVVPQCSNNDHGCRSRIPLLGMREFYRRLAVVQLEAGIREPITVIHNTDCVQVPAVSFTTHLLNGEHIRQSSSSLLHNKKDILDSYGIAMFASELSTLPWGVSNSVYMPYDVLSKANGGDEGLEDYQFRMTRASMAATLVHGTMQCSWRNHFGLFDKLIRAYDRFGVDKAKFFGYWRKPAAVVSGDDVYVSCYVRDGHVLAVVSHLGKPHIDQSPEIVFDWSRLGVKPPRKAVELMSAPDPEYEALFARREKYKVPVSRAPLKLGDFGTRVESFDGRKIKIGLPYHTFALISFEP